MSNDINTSGLRKPSGYKLRAEIAENRVRLLSGRVERLEAHLRLMENALSALNANLEDALGKDGDK